MESVNPALIPQPLKIILETPVPSVIKTTAASAEKSTASTTDTAVSPVIPSFRICVPEVFLITPETFLQGETGLEHILRSYADSILGLGLPIVQAATSDTHACTGIRLSIQSSSPLPAEGYVLKITPVLLELTASTKEGLFRGLQTLRQLMHQYANRNDAYAAIPCMSIEDHPHYSYRGLMLDVGRHFFDITVIKQVIDLCALLKLNVFHWHLTEDQGWRIEILEYPRLTAIGSRRRETRKDKKPVEGFYTHDQIREVVQYATDRFITVIPEIDLPGHIRSAIAAYPHLGCTGEPVEVATRFGIFKEILCAGQDTTLQFLEDVLDVVCRLFPGPWIHLGGDEAPKHHWKSCLHCQRRMSQEGLKDEHELQGWLTNRMADYVKRHGKKVIVWNDSLKAGNLSPDIDVQFWLEGKRPVRTPQSVNNGRRLIASDFFHLYFDYPHGMTPLKKTYAYDPVMEGITKEGVKNLLGVEAALWTEQVTTTEKLERLLFPRLAAMAEVGWCGPTRRVSKRSVREVSGRLGRVDSGSLYSLRMRYKEFASRLSVFLRLLSHCGVVCTSPEKADAGGLKGVWQTVRHFAKVMDWETIRTLREMW